MLTTLNSVLKVYIVLILSPAINGQNYGKEVINPLLSSSAESENEDYISYGFPMQPENDHIKLNKRNVVEQKTTDFPDDIKIKIKVPVIVEKEIPYKVLIDKTHSLKKIEEKSMYNDLLNYYAYNQELPHHYAPFHSHVKFPNHLPTYMELNPVPPPPSGHFHHPHDLHMPMDHMHYPMLPPFYGPYPTLHDKYLHYLPNHMISPSRSHHHGDLLSHDQRLHHAYSKYGLWNMHPFNYHSNLTPVYGTPHPNLWPEAMLNLEYLYQLHSEEEKPPTNYDELKFLEERKREILHELELKRNRDHLLETLFKEHHSINPIEYPKFHKHYIVEYDDFTGNEGPSILTNHNKHKIDGDILKSWEERRKHMENEEKHHQITDYPPSTYPYPPIPHYNGHKNHHDSEKGKETVHTTTTNENEHSHHLNNPIIPKQEETSTETKYITVQVIKEDKSGHHHYGGGNGGDKVITDTFIDGHSIQRNKKLNLQEAPDDEIEIHKRDDTHHSLLTDNHETSEHSKQAGMIHDDKQTHQYPVSASEATKITEISETKRIVSDSKPLIDLSNNHGIPHPNKNAGNDMVRNDGVLQTSVTTQLNEHKVKEIKVNNSLKTKSFINVSIPEQEVKQFESRVNSKSENIDASRTIPVTENQEEEK